jgi:hypothetical protein
MSYPPGPPDEGEPNQQVPQPGSPPPPGPPYGQYPPYGQQAYAPAPPTNGKATAALLTGLGTLVLSWCCGFGIFGVVAIVLGVKARQEVERSGGAQTGDGLALAGIITGAIAVVVGLLALVVVAVALVSYSGEWTIDPANRGSTF